jgi:Xaa-Pro aminopeptidase
MYRILRLGFVFALLGALVFPGHALPELDFPVVMSIRDQVMTENHITLLRLETLLPQVMRDAGFDMWIIPCQEDNVDAVFRTMTPKNTWNRRDLMLVFYDRGPGKGIERMDISRMNMRGFHTRVWDSDTETRWECLARIIRERNPKKIGINQSEVIWAADGLSATLKQKVVDSLEGKYAARLQSAEKMCTLWLETLLDEELDLYARAVAISHAIIAETYSSKVITPGVTTTEDLVYHYWQRAADLGLDKAFNPGFSIRGRHPDQIEKFGEDDKVIRRGDLLHCDVGIIYLRYHTDQQEWAYVLRRGETDVPDTFKKVMAQGHKLQDIFCREFKLGLTGNQLLNNILAAAHEQGLRMPKVYSHSVGYYLHEPGPLIGLPEEQVNTGGRGDMELVYNSTFTAELSVTYPIPEWGGKELRMALEQIVAFTRDGMQFLDGRQTEFHIVR